jgi:glycosyltransferase involved in cell wall biosynthesis
MQKLDEFPKISVFLPVYNQELYIEEAIESIILQNYPNLEIVIGDDCSTDNTVNILKQYKRKYPHHIKLLLSSVNSGITANCNKILKECDGQFIALFAGDDCWLPNKLLRQIEWFQQNPDAVLCYTMTQAFDSETKEILYTRPLINADDLNKMDVISLSYELGSIGSSFLVRKEAIPKDGYNILIPMVSDWLFFMQIMYNNKIGGINEVLTKYRRTKNNTSNNHSLVCNEHYLTLQILKGIYPELKELIKIWESKKLIELSLLDEECIVSAINENNVLRIWKDASNKLSCRKLTKNIIILFLSKLTKYLSSYVHKYY